MKKILISFIMLVTLAYVYVSCKKETLYNDKDSSNKRMVVVNNKHNADEKEIISKESVQNFNEKSLFPFSIGVTIEPIRIHRATTDRPRDGKNCGCNECFGLCNAPVSRGVASSILGIELINSTEAIIYFLEKKPDNFEKEFGIDEVVTVTTKNGYNINFIKGEYSAVYEEGLFRDDRTGEEFQFFGKVVVEYY